MRLGDLAGHDELDACSASSAVMTSPASSMNVSTSGNFHSAGTICVFGSGVTKPFSTSHSGARWYLEIFS
jgi:uridylate kinase